MRGRPSAGPSTQLHQRQYDGRCRCRWIRRQSYCSWSDRDKWSTSGTIRQIRLSLQSPELQQMLLQQSPELQQMLLQQVAIVSLFMPIYGNEITVYAHIRQYHQLTYYSTEPGAAADASSAEPGAAA